MQTKNEFLLGIDPGSYKTGVAKVKPDGEVISAEWVETQTLTEVLTKLNAECGAASAGAGFYRRAGDRN